RIGTFPHWYIGTLISTSAHQHITTSAHHHISTSSGCSIGTSVHPHIGTLKKPMHHLHRLFSQKF
ncbi:MAG TPA: hypothetical protein PLU02_08260, partial [Chitinophagales bacterium]|nr:hypothetical protein [Chitinophagales bacterium]